MIAIAHDIRHAWSSVRDQGTRPTCLAHAASDVHMVSHRKIEFLSAEALLHHGAAHVAGRPEDGLTVSAAEKALRDNGQPLEDEWPYGITAPGSAIGPCTDRWFGSLSRFSSGSYATLEPHLTGGIPALLVIRLTDAFYYVVEPWTIPATGVGHVLHAVVAAGVGANAAGEKFILIRNSWGSGWGDKGHAWLASDYLSDKLIEWCLISPV